MTILNFLFGPSQAEKDLAEARKNSLHAWKCVKEIDEDMWKLHNARITHLLGLLDASADEIERLRALLREAGISHARIPGAELEGNPRFAGSI